MCGITGRIGEGATLDNVQKMSAAISHRGPDDSGVWFNKGVAMAHQRLAIIDLVGGKQPMISASGRWVLIFNGEVYNFQELKNGPLNRYPFKSQSDTEVVLAAFECWGQDALNRIEGMFAIAVWDVQEQRMLLARDGQGIKPLYFSTVDGDLVFGSEIAAIFAAGKSRQVDESSLEMFLDMRFVPSSRTLFRGVQKLAPGHFIWVNKLGVACEPEPFCFQAPMIDKRAVESNKIDLLSQLFLRAVDRQLIADVPVGVLLSGGIDSAAVASAAIQSGHSVSTFCVGYTEDHPANEFEEARQTAEYLGTEHHELRIDERSAIDIMPKVISHLEEPVVTTSIFSFFLLCERVAQYRKVVLSGQGADEPWAGYNRHQVAYLEKFFGPIFRNLSGVIPNVLSSFDAWKRVLEAYDSSNEIERMIGLHCLFPGDERGSIRPVPTISRTRAHLQKLLESLPSNGTFLERLLALEVRTSLPDNLLTLSDKLSMAWGLEIRVPLLDVAYLNQVEALPEKMRRGGFLGGNGKRLHKKICASLLPGDVINRPKKGFQTPVENWLRTQLGSHVADMVDSNRSFSRDYLNVAAIKKMIDKHRRGLSGNLERQLFAVWILEEWYRFFFTTK